VNRTRGKSGGGHSKNHYRGKDRILLQMQNNKHCSRKVDSEPAHEKVRLTHLFTQGRRRGPFPQGGKRGRKLGRLYFRGRKFFEGERRGGKPKMTQQRASRSIFFETARKGGRQKRVTLQEKRHFDRRQENKCDTPLQKKN